MPTFAEAKSDALETLGFFWNRVFLDSEFVDAQATTIAVNLQQLDEFTERMSQYLSRYKVPTKELKRHRLFIFNEANATTRKIQYGDDGLVYGGGIFYGDDTGEEVYVYPIDVGFDIEFLAVGISSPSTILRKGIDYNILDNTVHFFKNPTEIPGLTRKITLNTSGTPVFQFLLFGFEVAEDIKAACNYFGTIAGICGESSISLDNAVNIAWDLRVDGATVRNIQRMLALLTGTDYVDQTSVVQEIFEEGDRICVLTDVAVYTAPATASVLKVVGETINEGEFLFNTYSVKGGNELIDFTDFEAFTLGPGLVGEVSPQGLLFENNLVNIVQEAHPDSISIIGD
jgi:hypothetical protein